MNLLDLFRFRQQAEAPGIVKNNPNATVFGSVHDDLDSIINSKSVIDAFNTDGFKSNPYYSTFSNISYMPIITDKMDRIRQYRMMAQYPECDFCIDEIADDFLHEDDMHEFIKLMINDKKTLNELQTKVINNEFSKLVNLFKFKDEAFNLIRHFVIEGEVAFENIIDPNNKDLGIIGVKYLPTEFYQTMIDSNSGKPVGIFFNMKKLEYTLAQLVSNTCVTSRAIFNQMGSLTPVDDGFNSIEDCIAMTWPQVTYVSSGNVSTDGLINFPIIEKAKQAYHQLSLMHDAAVILRVTRAPERLLFNIDVGSLNGKAAQERVQQFVRNLKSKQVLKNKQKGDADDVSTVYNPMTMLESYFAAKTAAGQGTSIESVGSSADYSQMDDIEYFLLRLFKQFKVPYTRYKTPENTVDRDESISYEEYSFARQIIRIQRRFASAIKKTFITHLKLRGVWDKYELTDNDIQVEFVKPILYDLYNSQKLLNIKMESYSAIADRDELSKHLAMKKILGYTDADIEANFKALIKEHMENKIIEWAENKVDESDGPEGIDLPVKLKMAEDTEPSDDDADSSIEDTGEDATDDATDDDSVALADLA